MAAFLLEPRNVLVWNPRGCVFRAQLVGRNADVFVILVFWPLVETRVLCARTDTLALRMVPVCSRVPPARCGCKSAIRNAVAET